MINTTSLLTGDRIAFSREALSDIKQLSKVNTNVLQLSRVVGASAGVPGLFPPTPVGGDLLVDGGVSDNQGLEGLWNEGCDVLLVSDASGQMERAHRLKQRAVSVIKRTNSIFQHQIRNQLVRRLLQWRKIAPPEWEREFAFVHLFLSLEDRDSGGVPSEFVAALGRIRTDLDEFNPVEREALMYHGYSLIDSQIKERCPSLWNRSVREGWAPQTVRDKPAVPRLFDEAGLLQEMVGGGAELNAKLIHQVVIERRGELKRTLEAGACGMLIRRAMNRHGLKAVVLLVLSWLLPAAGLRPLRLAAARGGSRRGRAPVRRRSGRGLRGAQPARLAALRDPPGGRRPEPLERLAHHPRGRRRRGVVPARQLRADLLRFLGAAPAVAGLGPGRLRAADRGRRPGRRLARDRHPRTAKARKQSPTTAEPWRDGPYSRTTRCSTSRHSPSRRSETVSS